MTDDVLDLDIHGLAIEVWPDVERVVRMLFPVDSDPDGEWLLTVPHPLAGDDYEITGVADLYGDPERPRVSFTLPADRMRDVMRQRFVISFDGVPKLSGPLRVAAPQAVAGETTVSITLVEPQALDVELTVAGGGSSPTRPVLASADWWTEASDRFSTVVPDRSRWAEHGTPAVTPFEIPDGTYLLGETIADPARPRVPHHPRLEFANGVRIMWRADHGIPNGWQPMEINPTGYSDSFAHQAIEDGGVTDALEGGLRKDPDDGLVRYFADEVTADEDPNAPEGDTQTFSDPLDPEHYEGTCDFCMEIDWPVEGQRRYRFYVPDPTATDLLTPCEAVEAWALHSTKTRTAGPGFYASALPWYLGDSLILIEFVKLFDLGTGDLAFDFQAPQATPGGWTDEPGNLWEHGEGTTPHIVTAPDDLILLPATTIPSRAANPGAGDWTLMFHGVLDPAAQNWWAGTAGEVVIGSTGWGLYIAPAEYGGPNLVFGDGTNYVAAFLGITDTDRHLVIARLNRGDGTLEVTVDGEPCEVLGDVGALGYMAGAEDFTLAIGTVLRGLAVWSRCLTDDETAALAAETAAPAPAFDPVGSAGQVPGGGGGGLDETAVQALIDAAVASAVAALLDGAPGALDTLNELAAAINDDASFAASIATALAGKVPTTRAVNAGTGLAGGGDLSADRTISVSYGTTAGTAAQGNDARLSDARTPTAHKTTHATGGGDALTPSDIGAAAASHTHAGLVSHVRAAADLGPRTHPTFTIDDILQFPCTSGVVYWIEGFLVFQGDATADLRLNLSLPSGSYQLKFQHPLTTVSGTSDYDRFANVSSLASNATSGIAGASAPISVSVSGWVAPTADGTVGILWGANSAGAGTGVTRLANSFLRYGVLT